MKVTYHYSYKKLKNLCERLFINSKFDELIEVVNYLESKNKHPLDMVLTKDFYPILEEYTGKSKNKIEKEYRKIVKDLYKDKHDEVQYVLNITGKVTLKKFLQFLFILALRRKM